MKLVSIIIPAYNAESYLRLTIESALNQTYPDKEIIIVNDGSSDKTLDIALSYEKNDIVTVINQPNMGAGAARNKGFQASRGAYIQFLDADDLLDPNKINEQINLIQTYGETCIYSGKWGICYDDEKNAKFSPTALWKNFTNPADWLITAWTNRVWMHPSAWLTPRLLIENAGLWNENLSLHDDGEFFCRVILKSKGIIFCKNAISYYRKGIHNSLSSIFSNKAINSHYNICQLYEKHLLSYEDSRRARSACAANYLSFHYQYYPKYKNIRKLALKASERLGGSDIRPTGTDIFFLIKRIFGWRLARIFETFYYRHGLNIYSLKKSFGKLKT